MKNKKGFTLQELVVVMAVSAIALSLVVMMFFSINSYIQNKNLLSSQKDEIRIFKNEITKIVEAKQISDFIVTINENKELCFNSLNESSVIKFIDNILFYNEVEVQKFKHIKKVDFSLKDNLIKCNLIYGKDLSYIIILNKRV